jgi:hypothetical protein
MKSFLAFTAIFILIAHISLHIFSKLLFFNIKDAMNNMFLFNRKTTHLCFTFFSLINTVLVSQYLNEISINELRKMKYHENLTLPWLS